MEQVFDQCQQFEEKRLSFIREVLLEVKHHLNLTEDERLVGRRRLSPVDLTRRALTPCRFSHSLEAVYKELEHTVTSASPQEDLKWFLNTHGPGMHMNWPHFEVEKCQTKRLSSTLSTSSSKHTKHLFVQEYNPDLTHNISKKERSKKGSDGVMLTNVLTAADCPTADQKR